MDEILALQQQLAAAQQTSTAQKLSDRNCVELVMKLQELNLINLIFTRTGKEYLTHKQLKLEIQDEILTRGGRINVIELPDAINVDFTHIEAKIPEIVQEDDTLRLERGELLTDFYLASLAEEINDFLTESETGTDDVGQIATKYSLSVSVIRETIEKYQNNIIDATFDPTTGILRSSASIARNRATVRGILRAITVPTLLSNISKRTSILLSIIIEVTESMINSGDISGRLTGKGSQATYIPQLYVDVGIEQIQKAYSGNGFVNLKEIERIRINDVEMFMEKYLKEAVKLDNCIIGPVMFETLRTIVMEAVDAKSWLSLPDALLPTFPTADIGTLASLTKLAFNKGLSSWLLAKNQEEPDIENVKSKRRTRKSAASNKRNKKFAVSAEIEGENEVEDSIESGKIITSSEENNSHNKVFVYDDQYIVTGGLVAIISDYVKSSANTHAQKLAKDFASKMEVSVTNNSTSVVGIRSETDENEDKGKKEKGKRRRRATGKGKAKQESTEKNSGLTNDLPVEVPSVEELRDSFLEDEKVAESINEDVLANCPAGSDVIAMVIEGTFGEDGLRAEYNNRASEAVIEFQRERTRMKLNAEKTILAELERAELLDKAAITLNDEKLIRSSQIWIRDNTCLNTFCYIVQYVAQNAGIQDSSLANIHEVSDKKEKIELLRHVTEMLAPALHAVVRNIISLFIQKDSTAVDFLQAYDTNSSVLDLPERRPLDKKREKTISAEMRANLVLSLDSVNNLNEKQILQIATTLVHAKNSNSAIISIPDEQTIQVCKIVEDNCRIEELGSSLASLRMCCISAEDAVLDQNSNKTGISEEVIEKLSKLRQYIG